MHRHGIYRLGSLDATPRASYLWRDMNARLLTIGALDGSTFILPMTQVDLGEVCGLTNVHVNRVLRGLREADLYHVRSSHGRITDLKGLTSKAMFDPAYLYLNRQTIGLHSGSVKNGPPVPGAPMSQS